MGQTFFSVDPNIGAGNGSPAGPIEEELVVVGIDTAPDGSPLLLLARESLYGLEYAGDAVVRLDETELDSFRAAIDQLACDYPHLKLAGRRAKWLRPSLRVHIPGVERDAPDSPVPLSWTEFLRKAAPAFG